MKSFVKVPSVTEIDEIIGKFSNTQYNELTKNTTGMIKALLEQSTEFPQVIARIKRVSADKRDAAERAFLAGVIVALLCGEDN